MMDQYPYTNFHELNLDWIIKVIKKFNDEYPDVMSELLKKIDKPIIAFKIFAGGQMLAEKEEADRRVLIKDAYDTIFTSLKPNDFAAMGIFQRDHDQLAENVSVFNEWAEEKGL
mgnify:CR=1 FL=1